MLIIDNKDELYMETDRSYYYKVLGIKYLSLLIDGDDISDNETSYSDLNKKEMTVNI